VRKIAGVLAGTAVLIAVAATPAYAVDWPNWPGEVENSAGSQGHFQSNGDYIGTKDWAFDNKSAVTLWETDYGRTGECVDSTGAQDGVKACNYDMKESGHIRIKVCHRNYSTGSGYTTCSSWSQWLSIRDGGPK